MLDNVVGRHIRRCNRNLLLINAAIIVIAIWWLVGSQRYLYNCYVGPQKISASDVLRAETFVEHRYFVSLPELKPIDAGLEDTSTSYGHTSVTAHYFAARIDNQFLLIKSPSEKPPEHYEGALIPVPTDIRASFQKNILDQKHLQFSQLFIPYMLDTSSFRSNAYISFAIAIPIVLLAGYNVKKALFRMKDHHESPIYKWLQHYDSPPEVISEMIDADLRLGEISKIGTLTFTPSWLLHKTWLGFTAFNLSEVVWAYKKITRHSYNLIPTGTSHGVAIADRSGRMIEIDIGRGKAKEAAVAGFLQAIADRIPWVIFGFTDDLKKLYKNDRLGFVAFVEQRRAEYSNARAAGSAG
jgi:hypothetical protein